MGTTSSHTRTNNSLSSGPGVGQKVYWLLSVICTGVIATCAVYTYQVHKQSVRLSEQAEKRELANEEWEKREDERRIARDKRDQERINAKDKQEQLEQFHSYITNAEALYCQHQGSNLPYSIKLQLDYAVNLESALQDDLKATDYVTLASLGSYFWKISDAVEFGEKAAQRTRAPLDCYAAKLVLGHLYFSKYRESRRQEDLLKARSKFQEATACLCESHNTVACPYFNGRAELDWGANELACGFEKEAESHFSKVRDYWSNLPSGETRIKEIDYVISDMKSGRQPRVPCPSHLFVEPNLLASASFRGTVNETHEEYDTFKNPDLAAPIDNRASRFLENSILQELEEIRKAVEGNRKIIDQVLESNPSVTLDSIINKETDDFNKSNSQITPEIPSNYTCVLTIVNRTPRHQTPRINGHAFQIKPHDTITLHMIHNAFETQRDESQSVKEWGESHWEPSGQGTYECRFEISKCCLKPAPQAAFASSALSRN